MDPCPASPAPTAPARTLPEAAALTFLFTDVEASTPLWERHEPAMRAVAARHDALLDGIIAAHGGVRVRERGEGDSLFAVFARPDDAAAAALAMARAVLAEPWPAETPIRVRIGLHTGSAQVRAGDYYGPVVNRCARIRGLGHGGQVLLSSTTAALVRDGLPTGASLRSLGAHSLKGLADPEEVFQLCHPDLPAEFPPLLSPQAPRHNLPAQLTGLIGREAEQGEVLALLAEARLVTLTGSGGVGKTRLALAVAAELVVQYADGVWLVELAALAEAALVPQAVAQALGVREEPGRPLTATLIDHLKEKRLLLVLDNCEHLLDACAQLAAAPLRACPHLRILATSREGLGISGERQYRVPSLSVPDPRRLPPPEIAGSYEAVRLFVARARERRADFALTAQNARAVAEICARLDGIPLAIELAAARVPALGAEGIAARLDDRFRLLTGGARDVLPRQRTLRAALDWSYDLLTAREQVLLDRLSVFAGGWTLGAAEAVYADGQPEAWAVLDGLDALVNRSLVQAGESGEARYALLETVRRYGQERLGERGEEAAVRGRHLAWCLALAQEAEPHLARADQARWLARLEQEHDNLRAALAWARESGKGEEGLWLAAAIWRFWEVRGYLGEGRGWLEALLAGGAGSPAARAVALNGAGNLALDQGDHTRATALHQEALALRRELGDTRGIAASLNNLGLLAGLRGDLDSAVALLGEGLALRRALGDTVGIATSLGNLGWAASGRGDLARATALLEEALALQRGLGDARGTTSTLDRLGLLAFRLGDAGRSASLLEESLALSRALGHKQAAATSLRYLGWVAEASGGLERADGLLEEALALFREVGDEQGAACALSALGLVAARRGEHARAEALLAEGLAVHRAQGDAASTAYAVSALGLAAYWRGEHARAEALHRESLSLSRAMGDRERIANALESLAWVATAHGRARRAARLGGATEALREVWGVPLLPDSRADHERVVAAMCAALGEEGFAAAWDEGRAMALEETVALALEGEATGP